MNGVESALREILTEFRRRRIGCAVVGGLAVSIRTEPRLTRDVDLVVDVASDADAEALVSTLGYSVEFIVEHEGSGRLATARLVRDDEDFVTDLLFASSGIEREIIERAEAMRVFEDLDAPVASVGHLLALKLLSRAPERPQDEIDLVALKRVSNEPDVSEARAAVRMIEARGYARGRRLEEALDELFR